MELRFSRQALADLDDLKQWLGPRSPQGHRSVAAALSRCIRKLTDHLDAGARPPCLTFAS
ncbi:type II toxin-antitoxin system RelE/ParE family toxin [Rhizobium sp. BG4]|nr:type II toxin-antitoxin system RelE/ParE family toxin [Rhizobium sp. BG4]